MKLNAILILLFLLPTIGFGQFKQSIDLIGGLEYSYRYLRNTDGSPDIGIDQANVMSSPKFNWRAGFNYNYRLGNRLVLKSGLRFASVGYSPAGLSLSFYKIIEWANSK